LGLFFVVPIAAFDAHLMCRLNFSVFFDPLGHFISLPIVVVISASVKEERMISSSVAASTATQTAFHREIIVLLFWLVFHSIWKCPTTSFRLDETLKETRKPFNGWVRC
jgi:hypothetical protein